MVEAQRRMAVARTYGQAKLSDLVDKAGAFEWRRTESSHGQIKLKHVYAKQKINHCRDQVVTISISLL